MSAQPSDHKQPPAGEDDPKGAGDSAPGTETRKKGGTESAKRQAQRDWQDSAKESGD